MAKVLGVIQAVPNQKLVWRIKSNEPYFILQVLGHMLVEKRANIQRPRPSFHEEPDEPVKRPPGIDDILY